MANKIHQVSRENMGAHAFDAIEREFRLGFAKKRYEALRNQRQIAYVNQNLPHRAIDGLGCVEMEVDTEVYFNWVTREGKDFWRDKANRDWIKKKYPQTRVESAGTKAQVGWGAPTQ
tara:strand:- start:1300 stop:1650 length:351 start_codon:yes stop_codon:yes gene_type:complete